MPAGTPRTGSAGPADAAPAGPGAFGAGAAPREFSAFSPEFSALSPGDDPLPAATGADDVLVFDAVVPAAFMSAALTRTADSAGRQAKLSSRIAAAEKALRFAA
jgi:hypothetical protein